MFLFRPLLVVSLLLSLLALGGCTVETDDDTVADDDDSGDDDVQIAPLSILFDDFEAPAVGQEFQSNPAWAYTPTTVAGAMVTGLIDTTLSASGYYVQPTSGDQVAVLAFTTSAITGNLGEIAATTTFVPAVDHIGNSIYVSVRVAGRPGYYLPDNIGMDLRRDGVSVLTGGGGNAFVPATLGTWTTLQLGPYTLGADAVGAAFTVALAAGTTVQTSGAGRQVVFDDLSWTVEP